VAVNETAIAVINEYPPSKFNLLIPVKTMQEISPLHKVVINQVQINPDPKSGKDVYAEKNGELALTKKGLAKLMAAANIQVVDSRPVTPQKCQRCAEIARQTRMAPRCGDCPSSDDVAYQVTIAVPEPSGTWRMVRATKELRMEDERKKMTDKQFDQFFPYRTEHCETKALNRALREALMISPTYPAAELQKPFAVAYVVPNMADPEMKRAVAAKYAGSVVELFGVGSRPSNELQQRYLTDGSQQQAVVEIGPDDPDEAEITPAAQTEEVPPWEQDDPSTEVAQDTIACEECGQVITPSGNWTPEAIRDYSQRTWGRVLCPECQKAARKNGKAGGRR